MKTRASHTLTSEALCATKRGMQFDLGVDLGGCAQALRLLGLPNVGIFSHTHHSFLPDGVFSQRQHAYMQFVEPRTCNTDPSSAALVA